VRLTQRFGGARARIGLWALLPLAALLALAAAEMAWARADLEQARARLLAGDAGVARLPFERYRRWPLVGTSAEGGLALATANAGEEAGPPAPGARIAPADLACLLDLAWRHERLTGVRALAMLGERIGDPLASLYLAALALESGDEGEARRRLSEGAAAFRSRGLGEEVAAVLDARDHGAAAILRDRTGRLVGHLDTASRFVPAADVDPATIPEAVTIALAGALPAHGIRLSLDLDLSALALSALGTHRGSIVLLDPGGSVLAAVSDPRTAAAGGTPAFEERREPASTSKLITTAAALRAGIDPDAVISRLTCTGAERFGAGIVWCPWPHGRLAGLDHALAVSCNMAFAHLGEQVGRAALLAELRRWGFDSNGFSGAAGRVVQPEGDARQLADLSIGLEATEITPLHAALLAAVMADGGKMPEPVLLDAEQGPLGTGARSFPRLPAHDVLDPAWLPVLGRAMEAVALYGTAAGAVPPDFPVAMKTGTASQWHVGYHVNYVGVGPWPEPTVAFCVRVTHETTSGRVSRAAHEVLGALLEGLARRPRLLPRRGWTPPPPTSPPPTALRPMEAAPARPG
jgi:penicillin-binding protein A